jgi:hypothetical protein
MTAQVPRQKYVKLFFVWTGTAKELGLQFRTDSRTDIVVAKQLCPYVYTQVKIPDVYATLHYLVALSRVSFWRYELQNIRSK